MTPLSLALVIAAAGLHAGWNLLLKQVDEKYIVTWWSLIVSAVLVSPAVMTGGLPNPEAWPYLVTSAAVQAIYMASLAAAYNLSDFSLVYPIARGAAPAFLALWAVLFLGEHISRSGGLGLALLVFGLIWIGSTGMLATRHTSGPAAGQDLTNSNSQKTLSLARRRSLPQVKMSRGLAAALLTALMISIYSALDGAAVQLTPATPYTVVLLATAGLMFTPFALRGSRPAHVLEVGRRYWRQIMVVGAASILAYVLVLNAYAIAQVSYAGAVREVSVVFGALAGWKLRGEAFGGQRVVGAVFIFLGVILIGTA